MKGWTKSKGIPSNPVPNAFLQDPTRPEVFHLGLMRGAGYLRSEDGGKSFFAPGEGPGGSIGSLAVCPTAPKRLYAIHGNENRLSLSDDFGKTWRKAAMRGFARQKAVGPFFLATDPADSGKLYLVVWGVPDCLWRSADMGESWTRMDRGLSGIAPRLSIVANPMLAVTKRGAKVALLGGGRIARIAPGEDRWRDSTPRSPKVTAEWVTADPHHPDRLWRTGLGRLWRSDDQARSWKRVGAFTDAVVMFCDTGKPGRLALSRYSMPCWSDDDGKNWRDVSAEKAAIVAFAGENLIATNESGVFWRKQA